MNKKTHNVSEDILRTETDAITVGATDEQIDEPPAYPKYLRNIFDVTIKYIVLLIILSLTGVVAFLVFFKPTPVVSVPNLVGKQYIDAVLLLQEKKLYNSITEQYTSDPSDIGKVIQQDPPAGIPIRMNREVSLVISKGAVVSTVPDVIGLSVANMRDVLNDQFSGFLDVLRIGTVEKIFDDAPPNTIIGQFPNAGASINNKGTSLDLIISRGSNDGKIFDMTGIAFEDIFDFISTSKLPFIFSHADVISPTITELSNQYLQAGIIQSHAPNGGVEYTEDTVLHIKIRPISIEQDLDSDQEDLLVKNEKQVSVGIVDLAIPNQIQGPIEIYSTFDEVRTLVLTVHAYERSITLPYRRIKNTKYEAVAKDIAFWRYTVTNTKQEELE